MAAPASEAEILRVIEQFEPAQARVLKQVRNTLLNLLPDAVEDLSWGMPTVRIDGDIVTSYLGFTEHNSFFPGPEVVSAIAATHSELNTTKGTIHFDRLNPPPKSLITAIVRERIRVLNAQYPKKSGEFKHFYSNGRLKAKGKYRGDQMHGNWTFWRTDGSLLRTGSFSNGEQTGTWTTYNSAGEAHKITHKG